MDQEDFRTREERRREEKREETGERRGERRGKGLRICVELPSPSSNPEKLFHFSALLKDTSAGH